METIKPCPFCGDRVFAVEATEMMGGYVKCPSCGTEGPVADSTAESVSAWNTRPTDPVVEAARKFADKLDAVHDDPRYQGVWQVYQIHGGVYTEPKYEHEFAALKSALDALLKEAR